MNEKIEQASAGVASELNAELDAPMISDEHCAFTGKPIKHIFNDIANLLATEREEKLLKDLANAYENLKKHGWQDIMYCPKDGSLFLVIEAGSTGIHECTYEGKWPDGKWWIHEEFDVWPSKPIMWKPKHSI